MKRKTQKDMKKTRSLLQAPQTSQNPRAKASMAKTSIWLPGEMLDWVKVEAAKGGLGMADEIRRRLLLSFSADREPRDEYTALLLNLIGHAAKILAADEPWHATRNARETFQAAINNLILEISKFIGCDANQSKLQDKYGAGATPETIGAVIAHAVLVDRATEALRKLGEKPQQG